MAEVKMDDDGTLQYIPIIAEADGLDAEGNGCVKIAHHKFEHIPGNVTKSWRRSLRLLSEFEVVSILQKVKESMCAYYGKHCRFSISIPSSFLQTCFIGFVSFSFILKYSNKSFFNVYKYIFDIFLPHSILLFF